ncbi:hypothetical protein EON81_15705 [bacterium]|nr:MAG: hypothetical protein EON81_15705 [bacterium]
MVPFFLALAPGGFGITGPSYWASHWAMGPRIPAPGDVDGDGRADLVSLHPYDRVIDVNLTSPWGKPYPGNQARREFGGEGIACVTGPFGVLGVSADGKIRVAWGMTKGGTDLPHDDAAGELPRELIPERPVRAFATDVDADGQVDAILVGRDGRTLFLRNKGERTFAAKPFGLDLKGYRQVSAGATEADGKGQLWWLDAEGVLWRGAFGGKPERISQEEPEASLVVGRFRGLKRADVACAGKLFPGGDPVKAMPLPEVPKFRRRLTGISPGWSPTLTAMAKTTFCGCERPRMRLWARTVGSTSPTTRRIRIRATSPAPKTASPTAGRPAA